MGEAAQSVVLVHGIWMTGVELLPLAARLRLAGFAPSIFRYASVRGDLDSSAGQLAAWLARLGVPRCHIVAHSLGGLIAWRAVHHFIDPAHIGRVVALGTPFRAGRTAQWLASRPATQWTLGRTMGPLVDHGTNCHWESPTEVGVIAGTRPYGIGRIFGALHGPNDGVVALDETDLPGAHAHIAIPTYHSGLVLSRQASDLTARFLREGRFGNPT
jgi:pimeloyl-ACP methyl ester carboxylesterase